jgi:isoquinoline 1-oxidoreductase subunit beta
VSFSNHPESTAKMQQADAGNETPNGTQPGIAPAGLYRCLFRVALAAANRMAAGSRRPPRGGIGNWLNPWVRIEPSGQVTVVVARSEMGQGIMTTLAALVAEEMDLDPSVVQVEFAPAHSVYANPAFGIQSTTASTSLATSWWPLRQAGASARRQLVAAAAHNWGVPEAECETRDGSVVHARCGHRASYAKLASQASRIPHPKAPLKPASSWKHLGRALPKIDMPAKVDGSAVFGIDAGPADALVAIVQRCPFLRGELRAFDATAAEAAEGVVRVIRIASGVAVVARTFWQAHAAIHRLHTEWVRISGENCVSGESLNNQRRSRLNGRCRCVLKRGDARQALAIASRVYDAEYELPLLAHAALEPLNCTAQLLPGRCEIWASVQNQAAAQRVAANLTGLPCQAVHIHTTFLGGAFGRRQETDFIAEAVQVARALGRPVKLVWSREDDFRHDFYRPASLHRLQAVLGAEQLPIAWKHSICAPSLWKRVAPEFAQTVMPAWLPAMLRTPGSYLLAGMLRQLPDPNITAGADNLPYAIPNLEVAYAQAAPEAPVGFWRSVGNSQNAFVTETFLDELAWAAGQDPYLYRCALLQHAPRHLRVLRTAAEAAGWNGPRTTAGEWRGLALHESSGTIVAQIAELTLDAKGRPQVKRIVCAVDCGRVLDPNNVVAQIEGGIAMGLSAALHEQITIRQGAVEQVNFDQYRILRLDEMPDVEVRLVSSESSPSGIGEPPVPPVAPAVANALFAATGKPIRRLPIYCA